MPKFPKMIQTAHVDHSRKSAVNSKGLEIHLGVYLNFFSENILIRSIQRFYSDPLKIIHTLIPNAYEKDLYPSLYMCLAAS
jgi:hypothetical protein